MTEVHARRESEPTARAAAPSGPRVLVFTTLFPNSALPMRGVFVRHRVAAVARHCPTRVVAPVLHRGNPFSRQGRADERERNGGLEVTHPAYATLPLFGRCTDGVMLYRQVLKHVQRIHAEFPFQVIDAHYAFPDGAAAVRLAAHFGVPVAVTVRGGDLDLLPKYRLRRRAIVATLQRADRIFAISEHLAARAVDLGAPRRSVVVVPNGVDPDLFSYADRDGARRALGIAVDQRLVLCVGNLLAEKGQHVLVEALARMEAGRDAPHLVLIGRDPAPRQSYRQRLERLIAEHGLGHRVRLLGGVDQDRLPQWYRAADLFVLPTFREGGPNVVREALACGTPVVASRVGGVPEMITSEEQGVLLAPGDVDALAQCVHAALQKSWDRPAIAARAAGRDWVAVGATIAEELARLVGQRAAAREHSH